MRTILSNIIRSSSEPRTVFVVMHLIFAKFKHWFLTHKNTFLLHFYIKTTIISCISADFDDFVEVCRARSRRLFVEITSNQKPGWLEIIWKLHFWARRLVSQLPPPTYPGLGEVSILDRNFGKVQGAGCSIQNSKLWKFSLKFVRHKKSSKKIK